MPLGNGGYMRDYSGRRLDEYEALVSNRRRLMPFFGGFARRDLDVLCIGDSKTEALRASVIGNRWINTLAADLRARAGLPAGGFGYVPAWYASTYGTTPTLVWTYAGGTATLGQETGLGRRMTQILTGMSASLTFTGTGIRLFFGRRGTSSDQVSVSIDGGAADVVSIPSSGTVGVTFSGFTKLYTGLASGSHTIVITRTGGSPIFEGGYVFNGDETTGIRLWDCGHSGFTARGYIDPTDAHAQKWLPAIDAIQPDLTIIAFGTNEYGTGQTPAQFREYLTLLISKVRERYAQTCFAILMHSERTPVGITPAAPWDDFMQVAREVVAADTGAVLVDMTARMPRGDQDTLGFHHGDGVHYLDPGNRAVSDTLLAMLTAA